jgi:hypothetical protein
MTTMTTVRERFDSRTDMARTLAGDGLICKP